MSDIDGTTGQQSRIRGARIMARPVPLEVRVTIPSIPVSQTHNGDPIDLGAPENRVHTSVIASIFNGVSSTSFSVGIQESDDGATNWRDCLNGGVGFNQTARIGTHNQPVFARVAARYVRFQVVNGSTAAQTNLGVAVTALGG